MKRRNLGSELTVFPVGLGCMAMTDAYGGQDERDAIRTLHRAVDLGVNLFDTAEVYGPFTNEVLVGKALKHVRSKVAIATIRLSERRSECLIVTRSDAGSMWSE